MTKRSAIAAVSPEPKVIDVFGLGVDNQVLHRRLMSGEPTTPDWEALGGPVTSAPTAVATGAGRLALCALDSNNSLQAKTFDGQNWAPSKTEWFSLGGICTSFPIAVQDPEFRKAGHHFVGVFVLGTDNQMYRRTFDSLDVTKPMPWNALGGVFCEQQAAVQWFGGNTHLFGIGIDNKLYHCDLSPTLSPPPEWNHVGGEYVFPSAPVALSWSHPGEFPRRLDVFCLGTDNTMWQKAREEDSWFPTFDSWFPLGPQVFTGPPAVASWGPNRLDVFGIGQNNQLMYKFFNGAWNPSETGWTPEDGGINLTATPIVLSPEPNSIHIFALDDHNQMRYRFSDGTLFLAWKNLGGPFTRP